VERAEAEARLAGTVDIPAAPALNRTTTPNARAEARHLPKLSLGSQYPAGEQRVARLL
jgi:hypothetical protein